MPNLVKYCEDYSALDLSVKNYSYIDVDKLHDLKFVKEFFVICNKPFTW